MTSSKKIKILVFLILGTTAYLLINTPNLYSPSLRVDFTEHQLFTLSDGAKKVLTKVKKPITLHFFLSENLIRNVPGFATYGQRVRDILEEIVTHSNGKITLMQYAPTPYSVQEEQAHIFGIQRVPIEEEQVGYFGLAAQTTSSKSIKLIEFFHQEREAHLEYDIIRLIHSLANTKRNVIGVMSSLPVMGDIKAQMRGAPMIPISILAQLKPNFELINLPQIIDDLPRRIDTLIIIHPRAMNERTIYELEQFLFRGGKALIFVDPKSESDRSVAPNDISSSSHALQKLFTTWGIETPGKQVVADRSMALRINAGTALKPMPAEYVLWLGITPEYIMQDDPVTNQLQSLNIATAGYIKKQKNSAVSVKPLIKSSKNSALIPTTEVRGTQPDVLGLLQRFKADNKKYTLAARLSGNVTSAFPNGAPQRTIPKTQEELANLEYSKQLRQSTKPINVILVADSDLLQNRFWLIKQQFYGRTVEQQISANGQFLLNAIENLTGSDELLKLRTRGSSIRPFEKIKELKRLSQIRFQDKQRELQEKLTQAQHRIDELKGVETIKNLSTGELEVKISLNDEQRQEIETMRLDMLKVRKQLRSIKLKLNEDVITLENWLKFINIGLVALLILLFALFINAIRLIRKR